MYAAKSSPVVPCVAQGKDPGAQVLKKKSFFSELVVLSTEYVFGYSTSANRLPFWLKGLRVRCFSAYSFALLPPPFLLFQRSSSLLQF